MGRHAMLENAAKHHFRLEREPVDGKDGKTKFVEVSYCKFCEKKWSTMSGSKQCAHICCLSGNNVAVCPQTVAKIGDSIKEQIYPAFKAGRQYLEDRARYEAERDRSKKKLAAQHPDQANQTMEECLENALIDEIDMLLAEAHHDQVRYTTHDMILY